MNGYVGGARRGQRWGVTGTTVIERQTRHLAQTTISNPLDPVEVLDHVFSHLRDRKHALWNCCLVSKS